MTRSSPTAAGAAPPTAGALRAAIRDAARRIAPHVVETPLLRADALSRAFGVEVLLKAEMMQHTGSFKLRGAVNRLLRIPRGARARGVVAASTGNHGMAVAHAGRALGIPVTVFAPRTARSEKLAAVRRMGAAVRRVGRDCLDAETAARADADRTGREFVSPYNDLAVVAGQGTLGLELARQTRDLDAVVVAVGGGGLIAGVAAALRVGRRPPEIIAAQPARSAVMAASVAAGRILDLPSGETLSDATAGGVEAGAVTFPLCRALVDRWVRVGEDSIRRELARLLRLEQLVVEGAAACALAALWRERARLHDRRVAVVLCGRNVSPATLREALE